MDPETHELKGIEIFAAGHWNGEDYNEAHLETIARSFEKTKDYLKPYLKIGHGEKQRLLAGDELPAAGFIQRVYKSGNKLLADITKVPRVIYELIRRKAYSRVSSELFVNFRANNETHPLALKAVAILGGETPAVHTLSDILNWYTVDDTVIAYRKQDDIREVDIDVAAFNLSTQEVTMTIEELQRKNAVLEAENKSFKEENAALEADLKKANEEKTRIEGEAKAFKDKAEALEADAVKAKKESRNREISAKVKAYVDAERVTPVQGKFIEELLKKSEESGEKKFSVDGKDFSSVDAMIEEFIKAGEVKLNTEQKTTNDGVEKSEDAFLEKVRSYAKEKQVSFKDALLALSPEQPTEGE